MKIKHSEFAMSAPDLEGCPPSDMVEFAFIGRSNVGKSSLINMLTNRKDLAMVSSKPGRTALINFFVINGEWCLVDLPGYGYARAPKAQRHRFEDFVANYLANRDNLACVFVLIDSRLSPQKIDLEFLNWLAEVEVRFVLVFTKSDKSKSGKVKANIAAFYEALGEWVEGDIPHVVTSSKTGGGKQDVLGHVEQILIEGQM